MNIVDNFILLFSTSSNNGVDGHSSKIPAFLPCPFGVSNAWKFDLFNTGVLAPWSSVRVLVVIM